MCQAESLCLTMSTLSLASSSSLEPMSDNSTSSSASKRSVSFDAVHVRRHPIILDESRTNTGLTIDWECFEEERISLEQQQDTQKRSALEPLGYKERIFILLRAGYSPTELKQFMQKP